MWILRFQFMCFLLLRVESVQSLCALHRAGAPRGRCSTGLVFTGAVLHRAGAHRGSAIDLLVV